jgi:hypothetical protein
MSVPLLPVAAVPDALKKDGWNRNSFTLRLTPKQWSDLLEWFYFYDLEQRHFFRDFGESKSYGNNGDGE